MAKKRRSCLAVATYTLLFGGASAKSVTVADPFRLLGSWLDSCEESTLKGAGPDKIARALKVVASSTQAFKTMDGAAHGLYAYSKARPTVTEWNRIDYSKATTAEKEDRLKALRKAKLLEEAMYSSELAELTAEGVTLDQAKAFASELQCEPEVAAQDFQVQGGRFRYMLLVDHRSERVTLSIGDSIKLGERLDVLRSDPVPVRLRSKGMLQRSAYVNPRIWEAAKAIAQSLRGQLTAVREAHPSYGLHVVGFSMGAGAAAMVAGLLEGTLNAEDPALDDCVGMVRGNITAVLLAPPPCISKSMRGLRRFTTSFILGDDMVPRSTPNTLRKLERKLIDYIPASGGSGVPFDYARSWVKGVVGSTLSKVVTHQVTRPDADEDEDLLTLPGRVYYIKPRKVQGGATIKEVLVGNLREDLLWKIQDVLVSTSMLAHHSLAYYVRTLGRIPL